MFYTTTHYKFIAFAIIRIKGEAYNSVDLRTAQEKKNVTTFPICLWHK